MVLPPADFESAASAIPPPRRKTFGIVAQNGQWGQPEKWVVDIAGDIQYFEVHMRGAGFVLPPNKLTLSTISVWMAGTSSEFNMLHGTGNALIAGSRRVAGG